MRRPVVGLTCNELDKENLPKQFIIEAYIHSVIRAGGCPIILPITNDYDTIQAQVNLLDGLIVTGGIDVNPMIYNENPEPLQGNSILFLWKRYLILLPMYEYPSYPVQEIHSQGLPFFCRKARIQDLHGLPQLPVYDHTFLQKSPPSYLLMENLSGIPMQDMHPVLHNLPQETL